MTVRVFILLACFVLGINCQAQLNFCLPLSGYYRCQGVFNYTGVFENEHIANVTFSAPDGEYVPVNPFDITVRMDQSVLAQSVGNNPVGVTYPLASLYASGSCFVNATTTLFDSCMNFAGAMVMPSGLGSESNLCGFNTTSSYYTWLCAINNLKGVVGVSPQHAGQMFVADSSILPTYMINLTSLVDGRVETLRTNLALKSDPDKQVWVQGLTFPAADSTVIPFWILNGTTVLVPNSKYFNSKRSFILGKNWANNLATTTADGEKFQSVADTAGSDVKYEMIAQNVAFCRNVDFTCNKDYSLTVYGSSVVTAEFLKSLDESMDLINDTTKSYVVSKKSVGNITATIGFSALFKRLPPKVKIISVQAYSEEKLVLIKCMNLGNAGFVSVKVSYNLIPDMVINQPSSAGEFTISIESARVTKVCIGAEFSDCVHVTYDAKLPGGALGGEKVAGVSVPTTSLANSWFNKDSGLLYIIQVTIMSLVSLAVFIILLVITVKIVKRRRLAAGKTGIGLSSFMSGRGGFNKIA